jgi:hypothetical protein
MCQAATTCFFPQIHEFPYGPEGQETHPGTIFENLLATSVIFNQTYSNHKLSQYRSNMNFIQMCTNYYGELYITYIYTHTHTHTHTVLNLLLRQLLTQFLPQNNLRYNFKANSTSVGTNQHFSKSFEVHKIHTLVAVTCNKLRPAGRQLGHANIT